MDTTTICRGFQTFWNFIYHYWILPLNATSANWLDMAGPNFSTRIFSVFSNMLKSFSVLFSLPDWSSLTVSGNKILTHFWSMFPFYTPENTAKSRSSGVFSGHKVGTLARNGLMSLSNASLILYKYSLLDSLHIPFITWLF